MDDPAPRRGSSTGARASRADLPSKLGGISSIASGALFLVKSALDLIVGEPPSDQTRLLAWLASHRTLLALTNEALTFAAVLLIPVALTLYQRLGARRRPWAAFGCAALASAVPIILVLTIVHGRLVYPVYGINLNNVATVALVLSLYYGGIHEVALLLAAAIVILGFAMRREGFGRAPALFGVLVGVPLIVGAYPWLIGPALTSITQAMFAGWLIAVGARLLASASTRCAEVASPQSSRR